MTQPTLLSLLFLSSLSILLFKYNFCLKPKGNNYMKGLMELADFPNEILQNIISNIKLNSDLARVLSLSHRFKTLTEPLLYRDIHLDAEPLEDCQFLSTRKRTDQLIANLKARPELGRYTNSFSLRVTHPLWYQSSPQISIIARMSQLRQLSYDPPAVHGGALPDQCKHLSDLRFDFSHVTDHYNDDSTSWLEDGIPLEIIAKHLWQPTLRRLQAEKVSFVQGFEHELYLIQQRMRQGRSLVQDIRFLDCSPCIDYNVLSAFITSVRHLNCFVFDVKLSGESGTAPDDPPVKIDLRPALLTHHHVIQDLALSTSDCALDAVHISGSFIQWTALKRLAMPFSKDLIRYTMLHEILPPQLEELQLEKKIWTFSTYEVVMEYEVVPENELTQFWELANNKQERVPGLKRLIWWLQYPLGQNFEDGNYRLLVSTVQMLAQQNFKDKGVRFEVVTTPFFRETPFGKRLCAW